MDSKIQKVARNGFVIRMGVGMAGRARTAVYGVRQARILAPLAMPTVDLIGMCNTQEGVMTIFIQAVFAVRNSSDSENYIEQLLLPG